MASFLPLPKAAGRVAASVALLLLMLLAWGSWRAPAAVWAPGHLNRAHADVGQCRDCHTPFTGPAVSKCLDCHDSTAFAREATAQNAALHQPFLDGSRDCMECHTEHRGVLASITLGSWRNPHGEFVYRATGAGSCGDCHNNEQLATDPPALLDNQLVRNLYLEREGSHRPGRTADCLRCHRGGRLEPEEEHDEH